MPNFTSVLSLPIDPTLATRLLVYCPLTFFFLLGLRSFAGPVTSVELFLRLLFAAFSVIYSLTGAPHLARYMIFLMPILAIGAVRGARALWGNNRRRAPILIGLAGFGLLAIDVVEPYYRLNRYGRGQLWSAVGTPADRKERTDKVLQILGEPTKRPVVVACENVQFRYRWDDRITIRSLDGRGDRVLLRFAHDGAVDHVGYLRQRQVDFLTETPDYNRDRSRWSLAALKEVQPDETLWRDDVGFHRLGSHRLYAIQRR
jgi:hypothetical protein